MRIRSITTALALLFVVTFSMTALAQGSGRIDGTVARDSGTGMGGVTVVLAETGGVAISDQEGRFSFSGVPAGSYTLTFSLGDNQTSRSDIEVSADATTQVDQTVDWEVSFAETITVVSASRRAERIVDAPSAVTVVTEAEIARQASHGQLPKLLEFTPGAEVTQSGVYDYNLNTRGFNSSLNRRVAMLIDGRDGSVPFLGSQEWGALSFPLDDIASLELIRGPGAALYGANASSGIVNVVTKQPKFSQGGQFRIAGGDLSTLNSDFRWAGDLGGEWYLKAMAGLRSSGDFTVSRNGKAEYSIPCTRSGQTDCLPQEAVPLNPEDDAEIILGTIRLDKYLDSGSFFTIEGGQSNVQGPVFQTGIGRVQVVDLDRPWARVNFSSVHWNALAFYNRRDAQEQTALSSGNNLVLDTNNTQIEFQTNWDFADGKARIVAGGSYGEEEIDTFDPRTGRQSLVFQPIDSDSSALFGQFDWSLSDSVKLVIAARWDDSSLHDSQFSPKAALVYSINPNNTLRFTYNEAFQVANYSEFFLQAAVGAFPGAPLNGLCAMFGVSCGFGPVVPVLALGNESLEVEEVQTFEIGYSGILGGKAFFTADYYNSNNENFITDLIPMLGTPLGRVNPNFGSFSGVPAQLAGTLDAVIGGFIPGAAVTRNLDGTPIIAAVSYTNFGEVDTQGVDLGLNYYLSNDWNFNFSYSWFDFDIKGDTPGFDSILLPNSPENKLSVGGTYTQPSWDLGVSLRWSDKFRWSVGPFQGDVDSYATVDLNGNYKINEHFAIGLNVANLFDNEHNESFGGDIIGRRALANFTLSW